jgi:hypothetical protein
MTNGVALAFMRYAEHRLAAKLRSDGTAESDVRENGARG